MSATLSTVSYLGATILFILSLGGLSNPETSRRGNLYGMIGMTIAVLATVFGRTATGEPLVAPTGYAWIVGAMLAGATIGLYAARVVKMTQMPELVALMHSLVGLAAVFVGYANYIDPAATAHFKGAEKTIHELEIYIGILIGAVTFSGSVIAFGKLAGSTQVNELGEIETPILPLTRTGGPNLLVKDEGRLPTGSFKARGLAMAVTMARQFGISRIAMPTNGNAGAALAAFGPTLVGSMRDDGTPLASAMAVCIATAGVLTIVLLWMGPETRGWRLER